MDNLNKDNSCWQYLKKIEYLNQDIIKANLTEDEISSIEIKELKFQYIDKNDKIKCQEIKTFIEKYEWLKKMVNRPTHRFIAIYKNKIIAVQVFGTPYAFSKLLGPENQDKEKLIARGASISWAPTNTGSWLLMNSINWMIKNTNYRFFTCYADTEANELGTIYQACNFIYLGKNAGGKVEYFDPKCPEKGWFSDRIFRRVGTYKRFAQKLGYSWDKSWNTKWTMHWDRVPFLIHAEIQRAVNEWRNSCEKREIPRKHKYVFIKGQSKTETKKLLNRFYEINPQLRPKGPNLRGGLSYPKNRGK